MARDNEWLQSLPRSVRQRFEGLGSYVVAVLEEEARRDKLTRDELQEIHLRVFIEELHRFLREGSAAAARAVDTFAELGIPGFRVGSEIFAGRNDAVMRGDRLAEQLSAQTGEPAISAGTAALGTLRDRIRELARDIRERRMG